MAAAKTIRSFGDLALNGAAPAFDEPIHVGRPFVGDPTFFQFLVDGAIERNWLTNNGLLVQDLEEKIAAKLGVRNCVAVSNGTAGLELVVRALGLSGEVIVPSFTFAATVHVLAWLGLTPVFADIDETTHAVDPEAVRAAITPATTGILATHLWGRPAAVSELEAVARDHGLRLIFDAAHAFLSGKGNTLIGNFGDAEVFSFHATKFFNTVEGGAVTTNDDALADRLRRMRNFGFAGPDLIEMVGTNAKMSEIHAAMGLANLGTIDSVLHHNAAHYAEYRRALQDVPGVTLFDCGADGPRNYQYVVAELDPAVVGERDTLISALQAEKVMVRRYFWPGCHRMPPYLGRSDCVRGPLPFTERVADRVIVLPTGAQLPRDTVRTVRDVVALIIDRAPEVIHHRPAPLRTIGLQ